MSAFQFCHILDVYGVCFCFLQTMVLVAGLRLQCKYKGHSNRNTQIRASFSADGNSIICGSDDGHVYIWTSDPGASSSASSQVTNKKVRQAAVMDWSQKVPEE